ncbi:MAG: hypothetical protein R3D58_14420 [Saprospiraceae bacterium]
MNWKLNYWTLLFAIAAAGLVYQWNAARPLADDKPSSPYNIPDSIAYARRLLYASDYAPKVQTFAADSCHTVNGGVLFFGIHEAELTAMASVFTAADSVTAFLGLIPGTGGASDTLDLMFEVYPIYEPLTAKYYDFTKPCPPCAGN